MKHRLALFLYLPLVATCSQAFADQPRVNICYQPIILPDAVSKLNINDPAININSNSIALSNNQTANFSGQVEISYRDTLLIAPNASLNRLAQSLTAEGGIAYFNSSITVNGSSFAADLTNDSATLADAQYQFISQAGRGYAQHLQASTQGLSLNSALFTTCPTADNSWALHAKEINIEAEDGWGEARHAVFKVSDIPVFYLPYLTFPVNDQRRSGVLLPTLSSSQKVGLEIELPYYFNLAPNYDLKLTPRYMSKRGLQLKSNFRYLTEQHSGNMQLEYLHDDNEKVNNFGPRYLGHLSHISDFTPQIRAYIDVTDVSDDTYLNDLGSDYANQSDTQLLREAAISYYGENVHSQLKVQGFEILGNYDSAYSALPELQLKSAKPIALIPNVNFAWQAQYAHFTNNNADIKDADRLHLQPTIEMPFITPALEVTAQASLLYTYYQQTAADNISGIRASINRTVPKFSIHSRLNLEREYDWFGEPALQTFEPQIQYLYIPYRDQTDIGLYDTTRLQDDYHGLFRQNRYSGLDRINQANQITLGWTSRFYDNADNELFRFSLGQIFFLEQPTITPDNEDELTSTESMLASELIWHWYRKWYFSTALQYDIDNEQLIKSNASLDYRSGDKSLFQLNHRYSRAVSGLEIQQLGVLGAKPISDNFQLVGSYYRDVTNNRMIDASLGLQYESCCWAVRIIAKRQVITDLELPVGNFTQTSKLDSSIGLQFVLKGFGDSAGFGVSDMLSNGIFSYRRPYLLTN
ncbi:LPS assembly protein LptD [Rheinheimera sp. MMS21-TC3]|uniref:LPS assembly protein LptD n=1 Tax=Rheinheimera sp. MMS21-TC3 TaxID=3072790 RepID=UPI0028C3B1E5|nr:LPS assembly protein LptD [Rheinheimera sp. MMS21-TC3]WNO62140.1 LPS assembly protein LptD [Rheinheimera sp. MMS21-TC3]